ncbi:serine/threonine-protein phosphatase 1 regulatory subunit 10-like [Dysidea avara]|uniref:serine/threonine-protein phosphatase 1 regulatory subunit 10-like n=1 Tax=Dysidea avara TaxID=196820 RepID=UPI0033172F78
MDTGDGPESILHSMAPHLGIGGCIKSSEEVAAIVQAMKDARLMVNKCLLLNIIKATTADSTLESLMGLGGWSILNIWLSDSKKAQNVALLIQLMQVLIQLPVTVECLKQGNMGKLVKQLTKQDNQEVKTLASELLTKWMSIFKQSKGKKEEEHGDRAPKRPRDLPTITGHVPPDKKAKNSPTKSKTTSTTTTGLTESSGFMNAISSQAAAVAKLKKPKRPPTKLPHSSQAPTSSSTPTTSPSPQGTTTTADTKSHEEQDTTSNSKDSETNQSLDAEKGKSKKRVSFASDDQLTQIFYFEMDESERSVMRNRTFMDAAQAEKMREREAMENVKLLYHDNMIEMTSWTRPVRIDGVGSLVNSGCLSEQRTIQMEREQKVLAQLFLSKESLPFSPAEPDPDSSKEESEPKIIPLWEPGMEPQDVSPMLPPPGGMLPGHDMPAMYGQQQHIQQGLPLSPGIEPNPALLPHPLDNNQPFYHGGPDGPRGPEWGPHPQGGFPQHRGPPPQGTRYPGNQNWGAPRGPPDRGGRGSRQVCKHFTSHGCRLGAACRFLHPPEYNRRTAT